MLNNLSWHWTCNNKIFFNKVDSIAESVASGHHIFFHASDIYNEFSLCNEPNMSWKDLLKKRAQELRDQYPYINLWFSGGCDSTRMLHAFIDNNIHIDEITMFKSGMHSADYEIEYAKKYLEKHKQNLANTIISEQVLSLRDYQNFYSKPYWYETVKSSNPINFRNLTFVHFSVGRARKDKMNLWGNQKPELVYTNNRWYAYFLDTDNDKGDTSPLEHSVWFYNDSAEVHSKQCHLLKRYIEANFTKTQYDKPSKILEINQKDINYGSGRLDQQNEYFVPKAKHSGSKIKSKEHTYYFSSAKEQAALQTMIANDENLLQKYKKGCDLMFEQLGSKWLNRGRPEFGSVGVHSKFYCLDAPEIKTVDELFPNGFFA